MQRRFSLIVAMLVSLVIFLSPFTALAQSRYTITQLTDTYNLREGSPQIDDGQVVWVGQPIVNIYNQNEIYFWDGTSTHRITQNDYNDWAPQLNDGRIVWLGRDGGDYDILMWENGSITNITDDTQDDWTLPQVDNGDIVWSAGGDIYLWNSGITIRLTNDNIYNYEPKIKDGKIIWAGSKNTWPTGHQSALFLWDGVEIHNLTGFSIFNIGGYQVKDGLVVWHIADYDPIDGGDREIYLYEIESETTTRLTTNNFHDWNPMVENGKVVWSGGGHVYLWENDSIQRLTEEGVGGDGVYIDSGQIAWSSGGNIFLWEDGNTQQLTDSYWNDHSIMLNESQIVWTGRDDVDEWEIFMAIPGDNESPTSVAGVDQTVIVGEVVTFDGSDSSDSDGTIISYEWNYGDGNTSSGVVVDHIYTQSGTYISSLTVTDDGGLSDIDIAEIVVQTVVEATQEIIENIETFGLPQGITNSFVSKLDNVVKSFESGNEKAAVHKLGALINEIEAQRGKALSFEQADVLIAKAERIVNSLK